MLGLRCIYGYLIIYLLSNHLKRSVYSSDPNNAGEGTSNSTLLAGSSSQEGPISQSATTDENSQPNQPKAEDGKPKEGDSKATPVTSVTVINLDININQTTDQYNISDHNGVVKFTPKYNHVFGKVVDGSIDIWKSKGDVYVSLVMTKTVDGFKYLAILLDNNMFKLFKLDGNEWKDITSTRHDITMLKFIGHNDAEIKATDYIVSIFDLSYEFTFKSGVNCRKIMYGEDDLWKSGDDNKFSEIKSLSLSLITNIFFVSNKEFESKQLTKAKLTLDIDKTESTNDFDYTEQNGVVTYTPKDSHVFNKISQGTRVVWESKDNLCGTLVSTKSEDNKKYLAILLENNMFSLFHLENNQWNDITKDKLDINKLKFLGDSDSELKSSDFKVSIVDLSFTYLFKSGANCRKLTYNDVPMWKHTDDPKFAEIKSFSMGLASNDFFVKNQSDESKKLDIKIILDLNTTQSTSEFDYTDESGVVTYSPKYNHVFSKVTQGTNVVWESKDDAYVTLVRNMFIDGVKYLALLLTNNKFTVFHLDGNEWKDVTSKRHDVTKLKFFGDNDVELSRTDYTVSIVDLSFAHIFNDGVICRKVKLGGGDVWKNSDYPKFEDIKSFQLDLITNSFIVKNQSDQIMHIGAKISLDIEKTESTDDYEYFKDDVCHTYTPKPGHIFNKISEGNIDVWESSDCLYGTLVRAKTVYDFKYIAMLLTDNSFKVFKLDGDEWQDVTNQRRDITKLKFLGENDTEIKSSDYSVTIVDYSYQFMFNEDINCKKITYSEDEVWKPGDDPKFSEIKKFSLGLASNAFFVLNASEFKKVGIKISLDLDKTETTEKYYINDQNGVLTLTPNSGYLFSKVSQGTTDIWESKDEVFGTLVRTMTLDNKKFLAILLDNNTFTLFKEESDGNWIEITSDRYDVTKLKFFGEGDTELSKSDYSVTLKDLSFTYIFNSGVTCRAVKYSDLDVWNHTDDPNFSEIKSLHLDLSRNKFYVNNSSDEKKEVDIKVSVDIDKTQNTDHFDHSKDDKFHTYTPKSDYVFNKVTKGTTLVWETKDDVNGTLVVTKDESGLIGKNIHVVLLLQNNSFILLHSSDKGKNWDDITSERHDVKKLKFLGDNDVELKASDYTVKLVDYSYAYQFNTGVTCRKVTYNNIPIWNHTDDTNYSELKSLSLGLITNKFCITSSSDQTKELKDITMFTLDIEKTESTSEFEYTEQNGVVTYTPKSNHVFNKVSQGIKDIWESKDNVYGTMVMTKTGDNVKYLSILLQNNMFTLFHEESDKWQDVTSKRHDITMLKFIGDNDTELKSSDYIVTIFDLSYEFKFKDGVNCKKITYGEDDLWENTDDAEFATIEKFHLGLITNNFFVKNFSDNTKELEFKQSAESESQSTEETTPKPAEGEDEEEEDKVPEFKPDEFKLLTTDQSGQIVELPESDYIHNSDRDEHTYDLNNNVKCNEIKYENKTVWKLETGSEKYPLYFTYKIEQYKFIVTFEDKFVVCKFEDGEWKEKGHSLEQGEAPPETKEMTKTKTTVLDLNNLKDDKNYDTLETGNVLTFTPKDDGEFSGVIRTTGEDRVTWTVIWQIQGEFELAKTISFEDFGKGKQVLILDTRSGKKMLYRPKEGEFWKEVAEQPQNAFETVGALIVQGEASVDMFEVDILKDYKDTKNYVYQEFDTEEQPKAEEKAKIEKDRKSWKKKDDDDDEQERRPPRYKYQNYAAKEGKGISNIIDPDTAIEPDDDDEDDEGFDGSIWRQVNPMQYATHASFRYTPQRCLAILLESANFLLYEEEEDEEKLTEITSKSRTEFFKLALYTVEKESNKYLKLKTENYSRSLLNLSYIFTFDKDIECHRITHDDITIWRHGVDPNFGTLKSIYFHLLNYNLSIENTNDNKVGLDIDQAKNSNLDDSDPILESIKQTPSDPTESTESTPTEETTTEEITEQKATPKKEPKKQLTLVQLDLIENTSSDNFRYVKKNEFATYKAKHGCLFNKVIRSAPSAFSKEEVVWESKDSEKYVKMVRLKLSDNHIALLLNNGEFLLFHKESDDKDWKDITSERHNFSGFKFFTFDQSGSEYKEIDPSSYTMGFNEFSYGVSFNVELHQIKHNDKLIYNYESDEDFGLLKGVYLGLSSNKFFLTNLEEDNKRLDLDKEVIPPKPKSKPTEETRETDDQTSTDIVIQELPEQESESEIPSAELTSLDINDSNNTPKYQFSDNGIYKTFTARHENGFKDVKIGKKSIWKSDNDDYAIKVRLKEASTGEKYLLLLFVSKKYQFFYSGKKNSPFEDITDTKHSFSDIKLFSKNETTNAYQQLGPSSYNISLYHLSLGYRAKERQKFHIVKLGNVVVYNYKDDVNFGDLRGAYLDLIENNLYVMNMNDQTKVVKELSRLKAATIDLNKAESTDQFHCTKDGDLVTYTSLGNTLFDKLIRSSRLGSDEVIWKVIDNIYAKKIVVDGQGKKGRITNTILHLENGDIKHLNYLDGKWIEVSNKISIDITKSQSSNVFEYSVDGEFKTLIPKSSFLFNSLVESDTAGLETTIWKTTNPSEYVNKLVLKDSGNKKYLAMFRVDNKFILLLKNPSSQNWEDISNTRLNLSDLKMFYFDNDTTGYLLFKDDQFSVSLEKFLYGYEFDGETKCHLVKFRDSVIWNHSDDPKHGSLKSVVLNLLNNKITISTPDGESNEVNIPGIIPPSDIEVESKEEFEDDDSSTTDSTQISSGLSEQDESSTQITIPPGNLIEVDLKNMESADNYEYIKSNDNHVFTAKTGFGFSKIKKGDHVLKECVSPDYYCKVVANYGQHDKIILYVYKTDKDFDLLLLDDPDSSSRDITSLPSDTFQTLQGSKVVSEQLKLLASSEDGQSKELDGSKLMIEKLTHLVNYTFEPDTKCSEIKYNEQTVWKYDKSIHGRHYLTNMLLNTTTSFILVESQNHYQYYYTYINDEWRCISGYKTQDLQPLYSDKLRIFTLNQFGTPVMDDTQFNKSVKGPITSFALNPGSKCVHVKYGEEEVWSYNYKDHEDKYPTSVIVNIDEKTVMVDCSGTYRYLFSYSAGQFSCVFAFKSRLIDPIDPEKIKFITTDTSGTYIELDKSKYDIEEPDTEYKFKFNDVICKKIMYGDDEVWKPSDDQEFSTIRKFRLGLVSNSFSVINNKNESKKLDFKPTPVTETTSIETPETEVIPPETRPETKPAVTSATKVSLDINATQSTSEFDYTDESGVVTYSPKYNHVFSKVTQGTIVIWESTDLCVTLVRNMFIDGVKYLALLLTNNSFKVFHLLGEFYDMTSTIYDNMFTLFQEVGEWKDITSTRHDVTMLKFLDENDTVITSSDYTVSIVDNSYEFKFNAYPKCTCIKYDNTEVWKHKSQHKDKYPTSVSFNNRNRNYLVVESSRSYRNIFQFQNNEFKSLGANQKLNYDHNSTGVFDPDKLKFMTTDPDSGQLVELDYTKYTVESPSFITYKFKDSVKCKEVGYENQSVWKYDENEHSDDFPTTVSINLKKSYVIVDSSHFYRYVYSYYDKKWKELPFGYKTNPLSDKFKLLTNDPTDQNKLVELDPSQYEIEYSQDVLAIKFNTNAKCTCIMYDNKDVWKYKQNEHEDKYPTTAVFNKKKSIVLVDSGHHYRYLYIYQNKEWKPLPYGYTLKFRSSKTQLFDTNKLQVFTMDKNNTLVLMPINEYDKEDRQTLVNYIFRYSKNCYCVKYDQKVVWEYKLDEHGNNYPTISLNKKTNIMLIESGHYYRYMFQFENGEWKLLPFSYRFNPKTDLADPEKIKLLTNDPSDQNKLVELEKSKYEREDTDNVVTFKIKDGVKCTCIMYDDKDVWKYNPGEIGDKYPTTLVINKKKYYITVESGNDYRYQFHFENGLWKLLPFGNKFKSTQSYTFDSNKLKLLSTNLSNNPFELDTSNYAMTPNGNILTYTLNPDVKCTEVKYDNISAWNYDDDEHENNYPTTIIFNRNNGFLIVESKDHYESYYSYYDNKWHSVYGYKASKITKNKEFYKLKLYETNDDGLLEPITGFHEEIIGPIITCNIFYGVKCTHVKYDEKTAWVYDYEKHMDHYPTSVVFNITNSTIKVECEDKYVYFSTFINDEWKPFSGFRTQRTNARPEVKLYQKDKSGNYAFINPSKYNVNWDGENDVYEYDLNSLNCALLKHHENTVWSQRSDEHPKSITYNSDQSKFVLRFDDQYIFCSFEENHWKKMSRRYGTQSTKKPEQNTPTEDSTEAETEDSKQDATQPETEQESTQTEQQPKETEATKESAQTGTNEQETEEEVPEDPTETEDSKQKPNQPESQPETESTNEPAQTETESTNEQVPEDHTLLEESTTSPALSTSD
ncbi:Theileria-specific hypothetical telomeric sfii fragment-related protein, putative [Theileria annulata]|uniref:Theileria-specific hypothetical telomeric sfii-related protein, putative n=1 Tax=Theileria annulata TaxID=5874 RepID=Q4UCJ2_THEAN|nr:Theileria-specific hypothetical telomeric sfii fragment-related protein, putative [Theileria annulata]CAI75459.1 Theileria-specific hypothetical telomeric sfii fragment-related protein, putative [Theileria annulata]